MVVIKKVFFILIIYLMYSNLAFAQIVSDVQASQINNKIVVKYKLNCLEPCNIKLEVRNSFSLAGNDVFYGGVWYLPESTSGDIGRKIYSGEHIITWDVLKELNEFDYKNIQFRVTAYPIFGSKYLFFNTGLIPNNYNDFNNISFLIGNQKYFISTKFPINGFSNATYNCDMNTILNFNSNNTDNISFNNTYKVDRFSFLIGKIFKIKKISNFKPLFAIGYGSYNALWGYNIFNASSYTLKSSGYAENSILLTKGIETQIGVKYNHSHFNFITSFNMIFSSNRYYYDCNFGIGFNLIKKKL